MQADTVEAFVNAVPLPMVMIDPDARLGAMNPQAGELFDPANLNRHYMTAIRSPVLLDAIEKVARSGEAIKVRYSRPQNMKEVIYDVTVSPGRIAEGPVVFLCFEDRTDTETAGQIRRDFVANVSHELKTPLTAVMGFIETLRGPAKDDPAAHERFLGIMARESERMSRLVSDLLSLSRVETDERIRPDKRVDVTALVGSCIRALTPMAEKLSVDLVQRGTEDPVIVAADSDQLTQVFTNLIENGIKYGGSGGEVRVEITLIAREPMLRGPAVEIAVTDYGEGFDPIHIPRLTERFYRIDDHRSREKGGTGLGLAIVKHIINRHRGLFKIQSAVGQGARFSVILPVV